MKRFSRSVAAAVLGVVALTAGLTPPPIVARTTPEPSAESVCDAPKSGFAGCLVLRRTDLVARPASAVTAAVAPDGFGPADLVSAYGLPSGGTEGTGMTVAVVDAYDAATAEADMNAYRTQFGLPACTTDNGCFSKVDQRGGNSYPPIDPLSQEQQAWAIEIDLDIEMVSAICPNCHILLVEADSPAPSDLGDAVNQAVALGADAVSMSWQMPEPYNAPAIDAAYFDHPGIVMAAATGDCGWNCAGLPHVDSVAYPAASPYVVAVGGTRLVRDTHTARGWSESAWGNASGGAGSGCARYESKPAWQHDQYCSHRTEADIAAVADPGTGVAAFYGGGWNVLGGTSVSTPIIASVFMLAGKPKPGDYPASYLYANATGLNDVTTGRNDVVFPCSGNYLCTGTPGYDGPTGLGTPRGLTSFVPPSGDGATYNPLNPARILDTRHGTGLAGVFRARTARTFTVAGVGGVPLGATAVTGNLTVTNQSGAGFLYVGPLPMDSPTSSTLNFPVRDNRANAVTVALGPGGTLAITYVSSSTGSYTADVIFDVTGYYVPKSSG
jgi:hypothetical protein